VSSACCAAFSGVKSEAAVAFHELGEPSGPQGAHGAGDADGAGVNIIDTLHA
jgi:hypothetical protein